MTPNNLAEDQYLAMQNYAAILNARMKLHEGEAK